MTESPQHPYDLEPVVRDAIRRAIGAHPLTSIEVVQSLWSGYGHILRIGVDAPGIASIIVKRVKWPTRAHHPRGWSTSRSHARKVQSYAVESAFYESYAPRCDVPCRVPRRLASEVTEDGVLLVLEDLDADGLTRRPKTLTDDEQSACLSWLAHFHATFLHRAPDRLWTSGTYWHLATRPDELAALGDTPLARAAPELDRRLRDASFQTLVHGDAKIDNFCLSPGGRVAAVDFQYVGGGCGIQDVAYFMGSCLSEAACASQETRLLDVYFAHLRTALSLHQRDNNTDIDVDALCQEWRGLYAVAWTDFYRFLAGWSPGHSKAHAYTQRLAREVLAEM